MKEAHYIIGDGSSSPKTIDGKDFLETLCGKLVLLADVHEKRVGALHIAHMRKNHFKSEMLLVERLCKKCKERGSLALLQEIQL